MEYKVLEDHAQCGVDDCVEYTITVSEMDELTNQLIGGAVASATKCFRKHLGEWDCIEVEYTTGDDGSGVPWYEIEVNGLTKEQKDELVAQIHTVYMDHLEALKMEVEE